MLAPAEIMALIAGSGSHPPERKPTRVVVRFKTHLEKGATEVAIVEALIQGEMMTADQIVSARPELKPGTVRKVLRRMRSERRLLRKRALGVVFWALP